MAFRPVDRGFGRMGETLIGIISVKPAKKGHIFLPITARNFIFVSEFVFLCR